VFCASYLGFGALRAPRDSHGVFTLESRVDEVSTPCASTGKMAARMGN
jgi:hypothetical protein